MCGHGRSVAVTGVRPAGAGLRRDNSPRSSPRRHAGGTHGDRARHDVHLARPCLCRGPDPGGKTILFDPWFANPKPHDGGPAGAGPPPGDPWSRRPLRRCLAGRVGLRPAWPCIHEMSLWLGRRLPGGGPGHRYEQGRHGRGSGTPGHDGQRGPLRWRLVPGAGDALPGRARRVRRRAGEWVPHLPRRGHAGVRRHGPHPRVPPGPGVPAHRRALHDGPGRAASPPSSSGCRTCCRSTGARSPCSPARRPAADAIAERGGTARVHDWKPGDTLD